MSDLIRREDVFTVLCFCEETKMMLCKDLRKILEKIDAISSVEPEQKKGKWLRRKGEDCWECSECHAVLENSDVGNHNFYYCYHCGADMMDICGYMDLEKANYE